jgi:hypothetical protein
MSAQGPDGDPLPGGNVATVVRVGDTIRRTPGPRAGFVRELLGLFESAGWDGAPRHLGTDERGRETLRFVPGHVPWRDDDVARVRTASALRGVAVLLRQLHDLTAGSALADGREVVCHHDVSPKNTVYRDGPEGLDPVAFIDWDTAAPGYRIDDVAHTCWQFVPLAAGTDPARAARLLRLVVDGYEASAVLINRSALLDAVLGWQDRCWRGIEAAAAAGDPAMVRLRDRGVPGSVRAAYRWTAAHRDLLSAALGRSQRR